MYDPNLVRASDATTAEHEVAADIVDFVGERFGDPPLYARVDLVPGTDGAPVLIELEVVEPCLYLYESPPIRVAADGGAARGGDRGGAGSVGVRRRLVHADPLAHDPTVPMAANAESVADVQARLDHRLSRKRDLPLFVDLGLPAAAELAVVLRRCEARASGR